MQIHSLPLSVHILYITPSVNPKSPKNHQYSVEAHLPYGLTATFGIRDDTSVSIETSTVHRPWLAAPLWRCSRLPLAWDRPWGRSPAGYIRGLIWVDRSPLLRRPAATLKPPMGLLVPLLGAIGVLCGCWGVGECLVEGTPFYSTLGSWVPSKGRYSIFPKLQN